MYFFYLEPHIYVNITSTKMLLYDTHTGQHIIEETSKAIHIVRAIYEDKNLGSVELSQTEVDDPIINKFIETVKSKGMGNLIDVNDEVNKPVVLLPILSLNFDVDKFKDKENVDLFLTRDISKYLLDVNVILNNECGRGCIHCKEYDKQFFCCSSGETPQSLAYDSLRDLLEQISYYPVRTINITGGNIYKYQYLEAFDSLRKNDKKIFNFYVHYLNYQNNPFVDQQKLHLIINEPIYEDELKATIGLVNGKEVKFHLVVENNEQFNELEVVLTELGILDFEVHPFYQGKNMRFFEENVFLSEEDLFARPIMMREIFRNQKLNANFFGSLYVFPNGEIKANPNEGTIGNIKSDRIIDVVANEMMQNTSWRQVRSSGPCKKCLYQFLCPPLSNYEKAINRQNLCNIFH